MSPQEIITIVCAVADVLSKGVCPIINGTKPKTKYAYGRIKDNPDARDFKLTHGKFKLQGPLPSGADLTSQMPPVYNQGQLGSCTWNALAAFVQYLCMKAGSKWAFTPSRLFGYYNTRVLEGTPLSDSGAQIRDCFKALNSQGVCPEAEGDGTNPNWLWPYSDNQIQFRLQPPSQCYKDAKLHGALKFESVPLDEIIIKTCLANAYPVEIGVDVYSSFESDSATQTGVIPMPDTSSEQLLGGHALLLVGYDDVKKQFKFRNSWGTSWGNQGYGYLPYAYVLDPSLSSDFWCLELVGEIA